MASVTYVNASCFYEGASSPAIDGLDLAIEDGELMVLVGPSGSGKSTALRMLAGLEPVTDGEILIGDRDVTSLQPRARDVAMVFQSYALYPHMNVADNMGFPLRQQGVSTEERKRRVLEAAQLLELEPYLHRRPRQLSGGQRQRVAMGRAIVRHPQVFLMDEPLSNLDAKLRVQTRTEISSLQKRLGITMVYVTHDQVEAMTLGHRVAVLQQGLLQQCDIPRNLYERPRNVFVAGFVGSPSMNLFEAPFDGLAAEIGGEQATLPSPAAADARRAGLSRVIIGLRPEALSCVSDPTDGSPRLRGEVRHVEDQGADAFVHVDVPVDSAPVRLVVRADARRLPDGGDRIGITVRSSEAHVFSPATGERLGD